MRYIILIVLVVSACGGESSRPKTAEDYINQLESSPFDVFYRGWLRSVADVNELEAEQASSFLKAQFEESMPLHSDFSGIDACLLRKLSSVKDEAFRLGIDRAFSGSSVYELASSDCPDYAKHLAASNTDNLYFSTTFITYLDECDEYPDVIYDPGADLSRRCLLGQRPSAFLVLVTQITRYVNTLGEELAVVTQLQVYGEDRLAPCLAGNASDGEECELIKGRYEVNLNTEEEYIEVFQASILAGYLGKKDVTNDTRDSAPLPSYESLLSGPPSAEFASYQNSKGVFARSSPLNW